MIGGGCWIGIACVTWLVCMKIWRSDWIVSSKFLARFLASRRFFSVECSTKRWSGSEDSTPRLGSINPLPRPRRVTLAFVSFTMYCKFVFWSPRIFWRKLNAGGALRLMKIFSMHGWIIAIRKKRNIESINTLKQKFLGFTAFCLQKFIGHGVMRETPEVRRNKKKFKKVLAKLTDTNDLNFWNTLK